jgi:hypothetical protein
LISDVQCQHPPHEWLIRNTDYHHAIVARLKDGTILVISVVEGLGEATDLSDGTGDADADDDDVG